VFLLQAFGRSFWLTVIGAVAAIAFTGTAFTASLAGTQTSNTATATTVIGAYNVTTVAYTLNATTSTNIDAITFKIVAPGAQPTFVKAQAVTGGTFYNCTTLLVVADYNATCASTTPQLTVAAANSMTIVVSK